MGGLEATKKGQEGGGYSAGRALLRKSRHGATKKEGRRQLSGSGTSLAAGGPETMKKKEEGGEVSANRA
eukprot:15235735-Heterocapsa_arctica.AAC.1